MTSIIIPENVTEIGSEAFAYCGKLKSVTLPSGLTEIKGQTFKGSGLESIVIPDGVTVINPGAFKECEYLKDVVFPDSVEKIWKEAFYSCDSLGDVALPKSLTEIGEYAFAFSNDRNVVMQENVLKLGFAAFYYCSYLETIVLPNSLQTIAGNSFIKCGDMTDAGVTTYYVYAGSVAEKKAAYYGNVVLRAPDMPFIDVKESDWFYESVRRATQMGLINGVSEDSFSPDGHLAVGEALKLAACMHQRYTTGKATLTKGSPYWYSTYADYCRDNGIIPAVGSDGVPGYDDYMARPNESITRSEYILLFSNALPAEALAERNTIPDGKIPDLAGVDEVHMDAIYKMYRAGIVSGSDEYGTFMPDSLITRAAVAAIVERMMYPAARVAAPIGFYY